MGSSGDDSDKVRPRIRNSPDAETDRSRPRPVGEALVHRKARWDESQGTAMGYNQSSPDFLLLEWAENGSLNDLIHKATEPNDPDAPDYVPTPLRKDRPFPNRVLWSFWLCMIRSCVAMAWPPRKFHRDRHNGKGPLTEEIPPRQQDGGRRYQRRRHVHFDIDPRNILIGNIDPNEPEHCHVPPLLLHDFGVAEEIKTYKRDCYYNQRRRLGKFDSRPPESFCADWDYHPIRVLARQICRDQTRIPGNWDWHTNVWQMSLAMHTMITRREPPRPPYLKNATIHGTTAPTYGSLLLDDAKYGNYDRDLREIVVRCLNRDPQDRPELPELLPDAVRGQQRAFSGETDAFIQQWRQDMLSNPGPINPQALGP